MEYVNSEKKIKKQIVDHIKNNLNGFVLVLQERFLIGVPDLFCIVNERPFFVEVKGAGGRVSPAQDVMLSNLKHHGMLAFVARSVADVETALESSKRFGMV
jgi:hypothetical protein